MTFRGDEETAQSLSQSTHTRGPLLRYFLAPGTANLHREEVIDKVLKENYQAHERAKDKVRVSLAKCMDRRARYYHERDELLKRLDMTSDDQLRKEIECREAVVVQSCIHKLKSSMAIHEDCLEHLRMQEPSTPLEEDDPSVTSKGQDVDVVVETPEEDDPIEEGPMADPASQGAEKPMEVDELNPSLVTRDDRSEVTPEEDALLMGEQTPQGDTVSVAGDLANLNIASPAGNDPEGGETS